MQHVLRAQGLEVCVSRHPSTRLEVRELLQVLLLFLSDVPKGLPLRLLPTVET